VLGLPTFVVYQDGAEVKRLTGDDCTPATIAATLRELAPAAAGSTALAAAD
jgi:hypothetical protein